MLHHIKQIYIALLNSIQHNYIIMYTTCYKILINDIIFSYSKASFKLTPFHSLQLKQDITIGNISNLENTFSYLRLYNICKKEFNILIKLPFFWWKKTLDFFNNRFVARVSLLLALKQNINAKEKNRNYVYTCILHVYNIHTTHFEQLGSSSERETLIHVSQEGIITEQMLEKVRCPKRESNPQLTDLINW